MYKTWVPSTIALLLAATGLAAPADDLRLVDAAKNRDRAAVRSLIEQHVDVNTAQPDGTTALAWVANRDDLESAELLIRAGARVNMANDYGVTPLLLACTNRSAPMVERLLKAGADPQAAMGTGETPLIVCARTGNVETVKLLLSHGADPNAKETQSGHTALMRAVAAKHPDVVITKSNKNNTPKGLFILSIMGLLLIVVRLRVLFFFEKCFQYLCQFIQIILDVRSADEK